MFPADVADRLHYVPFVVVWCVMWPNAKLTHGLPGGKHEIEAGVAKARSLPKQDA